ncbi:hypothetical protein ABW19_dt0207783 [Dactylella cylindrospora]|nr:hypothetical protein ABW19_dt0207783 [Dactylella cylindrospora]
MSTTVEPGDGSQKVDVQAGAESLNKENDQAGEFADYEDREQSGNDNALTTEGVSLDCGPSTPTQIRSPDSVPGSPMLISSPGTPPADSPATESQENRPTPPPAPEIDRNLNQENSSPPPSPNPSTPPSPITYMASSPLSPTNARRALQAFRPSKKPNPPSPPSPTGSKRAHQSNPNNYSKLKSKLRKDRERDLLMQKGTMGKTKLEDLRIRERMVRQLQRNMRVPDEIREIAKRFIAEVAEIKDTAHRGRYEKFSYMDILEMWKFQYMGVQDFIHYKGWENSRFNEPAVIRQIIEYCRGSAGMPPGGAGG